MKFILIVFYEITDTNYYDLKFKKLNKRQTLILNDTRELDRVSITN